MRKKFIAGNWKMHGSHAMAADLLQQLTTGIAADEQLSAEVDVAVFPPALYLDAARQHCQASASNLQWGAQCVSEHADGAYTGQISLSMLSDLQCQYTLIGHSERRQYNGETNAMLAAVFHATLATDVTPLLCVGEQLADREANCTEAVISEQLSGCLNANVIGKTFLIAYEPVWAIGTGKTATTDQVQAVHAFIRQLLHNVDKNLADTTRILYGGSVKPANAGEIMALADVDGVLVGGCSLHSEQFLSIIRSQASP